MKRTHACLFLLLSTFCLTGCSLNFQDFSCPDGSYSVKMPGKPVKSTVPGTGGISGEAWEVLTGRWNFAVTSVTLPVSFAGLSPAVINESLDRGVQGMSMTLRATTKSSTSIMLNGFSGREVELSIPAGPSISTGRQEPASTAVVRCYLVNSKMYLLLARSMNSITKNSAEVKTFFDSFKLNASASPSSTDLAGQPGGGPAGRPGMNDPAQTAAAAGANPGGLPAMDPNAVANAAPAPGFNADGTRTGGFASPATETAASAGLPNSNLPASGTNALPNSNPAAATPASTLPLTKQQGFTQPADTAATPAGAGPSRTKVTPDTKLAAGDFVAIEFGGQWTDFKVDGVGADGFVQITRVVAPFSSTKVPRDLLYKLAGAPLTMSPAADAPQDEPAKLPQTTGFNNPFTPKQPKSSTASAAKSRSTGSGTPATAAPKVEKTKSAGVVSLDGASVDDLLRVIGKKNEHRRVQAAEKLRDHSEAGPNPEVAKKIVDLLKSTDELIVRAAIAKSLEKWACPEIHDAVVKNLAGSTTEVRQSMIRILATTNGPDSPDRIASRLTDKDDRKVATEALISMGQTAEAAVIKMLNHRDSKVKVAACEVLTEIGSADAITALTKANSEWTGTDRLAARKALKALEAKK